MPGRLRKLAGGARGAPAILSALPLQARDFLRTRREDQCGRARFVQALDAELDHFVSAQVRQILAGAHAVGCQREGGLLVHAFQRQQVLGGGVLVELFLDRQRSSEERRGGKEWVSPCRSGWSPDL